MKNFKLFAYYLPYLILVIVLTPTLCHISDRQCWIDWAQFQHRHGISNTYRGWSDYLPLYHYVLNIYAKMNGNLEAIAANINRLKYITILFELGSTILLFHLLKAKFEDYYKSLYFSLFYFLNIAVLFNSVIWGQVDGIMTFFVFASIIAGFKNKPVFALMLFVLAVNMKLQSIIFLPLLMYILALHFEKRTILKYVLGVGFAFVLQVVIILPFYLNGDFDAMLQVIINSKGKYPVISMNAYNIWGILLDNRYFFKPDTLGFWGLNYNLWGLIFFFVSSFLILVFPLFRVINTLFRNRKQEINLNEILLIGALIPLFFFFFNTQMHERYVHPALVFITAYGLLNRKILVIIIPSIAYILNLEGAAHIFNLTNYGTLIFTPRFVAILYLITIILLFYELFKLQKTLFTNLKESSDVV